MHFSKRVLSFLLVGISLFINLVTSLAAEEPKINDPRLEKAILLYVGSSTAFVHNVRTQIDADNSAVFPVVKSGRTLVPVRFIAESLGADVNWDKSSNTVVVKLNDKTVKLVLSQQVMSVNDIKTVLDVPAQTISGRTFIPLRALVEALGQQVDYFDGLIIISSEASLIDSNKETDLLNKIIAMFNTSTPVKMKNIAGGEQFSVAVGDDGSIWTWGDNFFGQLGDGTRISRSIPQRIKGLSGFKAVACGANHTLALKGDGTVWAWGHNYCYQLGTGDKLNKSPVLVKGLTNVKSLAAGFNHSVALKNDGTVWTWGRNYECQLGRITAEKESAAPGKIKELTGIIAIAAMGDYSAALKKDGTVWIWGDVYEEIQKPIKVNGLNRIKSIALTAENVFALGNDNTVLRYNTFNRKGIKKIPNFTNISLISCSKYQIAALKNDGSLWLSGETHAVSVAYSGPEPEYDASTMVEGVTNVQSIASGYNHLFILKNDGTVWGLGNNKLGQLGNGIKIAESVPNKVIGLSNVVAVDASNYQSMALLGDGRVSVWGDAMGEFISWDNNSTPKVISDLDSIIAIAGTNRSFAVLKSDGTVWRWGSNAGDVPAKAETLEDITSITGGENYDYRFAALKNDGTVWEWADISRNSIPHMVRGVTDITAISKGVGNTVALRKDGTVWGWSNFSSFEDDLPDTEDVPEQIPGLNDVIAVSTEKTISFALKNDGTVWVWEVDKYGCFNGKPPIQVKGLAGITAISDSSIAIKNDGTVWTWGYYVEDGKETMSTTDPVKVSGLSNIVEISSGFSHSLALDKDGTVWAWGLNCEGQLGDGTVLYEETPVQVMI